MNQVIEVLMKRRSVRAYQKKEIGADIKAEILKATLRAPTAGNMMLYSIVEVTDQKIKDRLAITCDDQPFIARAPMVWLFVADYQRWFDYFIESGVEDLCQAKKVPMRKPEEGDLFLACCDALIAAQNAVIAAESCSMKSIKNCSTCLNTFSQFACLFLDTPPRNSSSVHIQGVSLKNLFSLRITIIDLASRSSKKCSRSVRNNDPRRKARKVSRTLVKPCIFVSSTRNSLSR